jgi:hypothetical protein
MDTVAAPGLLLVSVPPVAAKDDPALPSDGALEPRFWQRNRAMIAATRACRERPCALAQA